MPVSQQLATNLPPTLLLASLGLRGGRDPDDHPGDRRRTWSAWNGCAPGCSPLPSLFISVPVFWLGIMLIQIFSFQLGLVSVISPGPVERLVLPVLTLGHPDLRAAGADPDAQHRPGADAALRRRRPRQGRLAQLGPVEARGAQRHRCRPSPSRACCSASCWPAPSSPRRCSASSGLGGLTYQAVGNHDTAVLQAIVVISALAFVTINLIVDLLYPVLDPAARHARREHAT